MSITEEIKFEEIENLHGIATPKWMVDLHRNIYIIIVDMIVDRVSSKLAELNEKAERLGLEYSSDLDAPYNRYMRNESQKIADEFMMEVTGGSKVYSGNGMNYAFKIDKNYGWHMDIYSEIYGIRQEMYVQFF
jgi:hypothetical protein